MRGFKCLDCVAARDSTSPLVCLDEGFSETTLPTPERDRAEDSLASFAVAVDVELSNVFKSPAAIGHAGLAIQQWRHVQRHSR